MKTRRLGNSDLEITVLGFGSWAAGGGQWEFAWGPQDDAASIAAIRRALECGVNWIDTAGVYGLGHSEEVVARALEGVSRRPYVFTKCSMTWDANGKIGRSLRAGSVRRECEASLRRLRVEAIDLYQIHWPVPIRRRWTRAGRRSPPSSRREGPLDRRVELRRRAARVRRGPRAGDLAAAALLAAAPRHRAGRAAPLPGTTGSASSPTRRWAQACSRGR